MSRRQSSPGFLRSARVVVIAVVVATSGDADRDQQHSSRRHRPGHHLSPRETSGTSPDDSATGDGVSTGNVLPAGHPHPTGGGVQITGVDPQLDLEVHATGPSGRKWRVQGNNNSGSDAEMTIFAICANR